MSVHLQTVQRVFQSGEFFVGQFHFGSIQAKEI